MNRSNRPSRARILLALLLQFLPLTVFAFSYIVSETQINNVLKLTFPYQTRMGNSQINLTDPQPLFYAATQEMGLTIHISMKEGDQPDITARASLKGGIQFDKKQQQLHLVRPKIENLSWINPPKQDQKHLRDMLEQRIGQELPLIVLLDIKQLTNNIFTPTLSDIKVRDNGVEVVL
jgi:hypothetical protein